MTQKSLYWFTNGFTGSVGDGAAAYTQAEHREYHHATLAKKAADAGVFRGVDNEFATTGTTSPLAVNTGWAIAYGFPIKSSASENLAVTLPLVGDTGGRIVLEADWVAATVRLKVILNTDGTAAIPTLTQVALTTWQIPIAQFVIDLAGNIWNTSAKTVAGALDDRVFTTQRTRRFFVPAIVGDNTTDGGNLLNLGNALIMPDNKTASGYGGFTCPDDFLAVTSLKTVVWPSGTGNINCSASDTYFSCGEVITTHTENLAPTDEAATLDTATCIKPLLLASLVIGDIVRVSFTRNGAAAGDTIGADVKLLGWIFEYIADI